MEDEVVYLFNYIAISKYQNLINYTYDHEFENQMKEWMYEMEYPHIYGDTFTVGLF